MRRFLLRPLIAFALLFAAATPSLASTIALDVTSTSQIFSVGTFPNVGWQFSVSSTITVDGLGIFDINVPGLTDTHTVGLWNNGGSLLASTTVTSGSTFVSSVSTNGDWLFSNIAPIVLVPGTYIVGAFYPTTADQVLASASILLAPQVSFLASRAGTQAVFTMPDVYGLVEPGVFGANFRIADAVATPEPGTFVLFGTALAGLAIVRRRRT